VAHFRTELRDGDSFLFPVCNRVKDSLIEYNALFELFKKDRALAIEYRALWIESNALMNKHTALAI